MDGLLLRLPELGLELEPELGLELEPELGLVPEPELGLVPGLEQVPQHQVCR